MGNKVYLAKRGTDHATNGIEMGIDGWIYIAVGDYSFYNVMGRDGTKLTEHGGGVARVRPDGSELEFYAHGTRNIYDTAIDPEMDLFTRDNSNDGEGWNVRFSHIIQSGEYGYPALFKHFTEEIIPALADLGGGSGTGMLYMDNSHWPKKYNNVVMSADWGRNYLYINRLTPDGGTYIQKQEQFIQVPQPIGVDVGPAGTLYITAWDGAGFKGDSTKGYTLRAVPKGYQPKDFPDFENASVKQLRQELKSRSAKVRLDAQYELLRRPKKKAGKDAWRIANNKQLPLDVRVAGIFTYAQITGEKGLDNLVKLTHEKKVREFALRALADRKPYIDQVPIKPFLSALKSPSDRVKIAAVVGLCRLGRKKAVHPLLKEISVPSSFKAPKLETIGPHATPNPEIIVPHVAVRSLLKIGDTDALLDAVEKDHNKLALWTLRYVHKVKVPKRLIGIYKKSTDKEFKHQILHNLARIYHKKKPYDGTTWWTTQPDTHGPYEKGIDWKGTSIIRKFLINQWQHSNASGKKLFKKINSRYRLGINEFDKINKKVMTTDTTKYNQVTAERGHKIAKNNGCFTCHSRNGTRGTGPTFKNLYGRTVHLKDGSTITADSAYIAKSINTPRAQIVNGYLPVMPKFNLKEDQIKSIIKYIKSISEEKSNK
jgi:cytochrome c2